MNDVWEYVCLYLVHSEVFCICVQDVILCGWLGLKHQLTN